MKKSTPIRERGPEKKKKEEMERKSSNCPKHRIRGKKLCKRGGGWGGKLMGETATPKGKGPVKKKKRGRFGKKGEPQPRGKGAMKECKNRESTNG